VIFLPEREETGPTILPPSRGNHQRCLPSQLCTLWQNLARARCGKPFASNWLRVTNRAACGHVTFTLLSEHFERMKDHTRETIPVSYLLVLLPHQRIQSGTPSKLYLQVKPNSKEDLLTGVRRSKKQKPSGANRTGKNRKPTSTLTTTTLESCRIG